jgi:uncharacterized protein (TIGR02271 family)
MLDQSQVRDVLGRDAYDPNGSKIGKVGQLYFDDETGRPAWLTVNTGFFGTSENFVPAENAEVRDDHVQVPFDKETVKDAPSIDADEHISREQEQRLYEYYRMDYLAGYTPSEVAGDQGSGGTGAPKDDAMTRSEEQLVVGKTEHESGRARLRKYIVTEEESVTVPVRKEKAVIEREPITEGNVDEATSGPDLSEAEHEVTLHEEQVVVDKTTEPVERVRLGTEDVEQQQTVSEDVRKERVEAQGDIDERR